MTKENYTHFSNVEIIQFVRELNKRPDILNRYLDNHYPDLFKEIIFRTHFLDDEYYYNRPVPIMARLYCLEHDIKISPRCQNPTCPGNNFVGWNNKTKSFLKHCCCKCAAQNPQTDLLKRQTNLSLRGVEYIFQSKEVRDLITHSDESIQRFKQTYSDKFGGIGFQSKIIQEKSQRTLIEHFGVKHPLQSKEILQKMKTTILNRFGVENVSQSENIKLKKKQTSINRYGVGHPSQSQEVKDKYKLRCQVNWGVDNYSQTTDFQKKCHKRYTNSKYPDMTFATSWEFLVYDFLTEHNIPFECQPSISIPYECEGTHHTYHPDFKVGDRIVEVKGDNFFRINEETGQEEMYLTWKGDLSDEEYEWKCKLMEAKHQCMIAHDVIILRQTQIKNLSLKMFDFPNNSNVV